MVERPDWLLFQLAEEIPSHFNFNEMTFTLFRDLFETVVQQIIPVVGQQIEQ